MGLFDKLKVLVGNDKKSAPIPTAALPVKKILIVEDDPLFSHALSLKFSNAGYGVLLAENGAVGLDVLVAQKPDLVLLDLMMPVMDGKTMLKKLREIPEFLALPVFILTNAGDADTMMQTKTYYNAGEFLIKSNVTPDEILQKVRMRLGS